MYKSNSFSNEFFKLVHAAFVVIFWLKTVEGNGYPCFRFVMSLYILELQIIIEQSWPGRKSSSIENQNPTYNSLPTKIKCRSPLITIIVVTTPNIICDYSCFLRNMCSTYLWRMFLLFSVTSFVVKDATLVRFILY